jgi:uncharacterized protein with PQ loop repeat
MTFLAVAAAVSGVMMGASPLLQARRILHLRSSRDVSTGFFAAVVAGQLIWTSYGIGLHNFAVVASNGCGALVNALVLVTAAWARRQKTGDAAGYAEAAR